MNLFIIIQIKLYIILIIKSFKNSNLITKSKAINFHKRGNITKDFISLYEV